jgi:16S rRNA (adenine1518-N6/adenine1519-N6)-dimethyltransferase
VPNKSLDQLPPLRDVIAAHDLRAKKSLGQNFILDLAITARIAAQAQIKAGQTVVEIGPGPGGLTRALLGTDAAQVIAIEFDPRAVRALQDVVMASDGRLIILQDDALKMDWADFFAQRPGAVIVANLPYNISTVLLVQWLELIARTPGLIGGMTLMFQREVAQRLCAHPHTKDFGRLSVLTQWLVDTREAMVLPPGAFTPPPKIHSSVVRMIPRARQDADPKWETMDKVLQTAFAQRRKMLRTNLKAYLPLLEKLGIAPTDRAEDLAVDTYVALAKAAEAAGL